MGARDPRTSFVRAAPCGRLPVQHPSASCAARSSVASVRPPAPVAIRDAAEPRALARAVGPERWTN